MSVRISDKDRGLVAHKKKFAHNARVTVGIHEAEGSEAKEGSGTTSLMVVAEAHEFGLGVPPRSFVAGAVDDNEAELTQKLNSAIKASAKEGGRGPEQTLERFGLYVVGVMQQRISDGIEPGLADSTKKAKKRITGEAKDTPLILTGQLRSSIRSKLEVTS